MNFYAVKSLQWVIWISEKATENSLKIVKNKQCLTNRELSTVRLNVVWCRCTVSFAWRFDVDVSLCKLFNACTIAHYISKFLGVICSEKNDKCHLFRVFSGWTFLNDNLQNNNNNNNRSFFLFLHISCSLWCRFCKNNNKKNDLCLIDF